MKEQKQDDTLAKREDLAPLVAAYHEARAAHDAAKAEYETARAALQEAMGDCQAALVGGHKVYYRVVEPSPSLDTRRLRADKPRLYAMLLERWQKQRAPYRSLRITGGEE